MQWQTTTKLPEYNFSINHQDKVLLLGSCFAENIGKRLSRRKFNVLQNPTGIVYNPLSLLRTIELICSNKTFTEHDLEVANSTYYSYDHHSKFSNSDVNQVLKNINNGLHTAREWVSNSKVVFISLGTAYYWLLKGDGRVVNNCHKQPSKLFELKRATVAEVRQALESSINLLREKNNSVEVVFTISPIRHLKHGSLGNQLSKSTLLVAAQELVHSAQGVHYFPSYELLLDDLRDYRWYEEDLIHPNKQALDYIWNNFCNSLLSENSLNALKPIESFLRLLEHRPLNSSAENIENQLKKLLSAASTLEKTFGISVNGDVEVWKQRNC